MFHPNRYPEPKTTHSLGKDVSTFLEKDRTLANREFPTPDFFIVGAAKAGTTSLFEYLGQHPSVFVPEQKEPGYFSALRPMSDPKRYAALFGAAQADQIIGEASTDYMPSPDSPRRIAEVCADAKIILMLRNPADRAFSLYRHMVRYGQEMAPTFQRALQLEPKRRESESFLRDNTHGFFNYMYLSSGLYYRQINRFSRYFDDSQIKFVTFDNFTNRPIEETQSVLNFLGLQDSFHPRTRTHNERQDVYSPRLQTTIAQYVRDLPAGLRLASILTQTNKALFSLITGQSKSNLDKDLRRRLLNWYEKDIKKTGDLIGYGLENYWLSDS